MPSKIVCYCSSCFLQKFSPQTTVYSLSLYSAMPDDPCLPQDREGTPTILHRHSPLVDCHLCRFWQLLLEYDAHEGNSDTLLESLGPIKAQAVFLEENLAQHQTWGLAASQLCAWVQGVVNIHSILQTTVQPVRGKIADIKFSLSELSDKIRMEEHKVLFPHVTICSCGCHMCMWEVCTCKTHAHRDVYYVHVLIHLLCE